MSIGLCGSETGSSGFLVTAFEPFVGPFVEPFVEPFAAAGATLAFLDGENAASKDATPVEPKPAGGNVAANT